MARDASAGEVEPLLQVALQVAALRRADHRDVEDAIGRRRARVERNVGSGEPDVEDLDGEVVAGEVLAVDLESPPGRPRSAKLLQQDMERLVHLATDELVPDADLVFAREQVGE